jgi:Lysophospholipase L1 and related esterases
MSGHIRQQSAESFVFVREEPLPLRHKPRVEAGVALTGHGGGTVFQENVDYVVDYERGLIRRTANSRIPDWSQHPMYGVRNFDHLLYRDYSNLPYTVYAKYEYTADREETVGDVKRAAEILPRTVAKLTSASPVKYAVLGDSISTGGEASSADCAFFGRLSRYLRERFAADSGAEITIVNKAVGGETSEGGAARVERDVLPLEPDLVTVGYGMNDQNLFATGLAVPPNDFVRNIETIIRRIRNHHDCDIILITPCSPNPLWKHASGKTKDYAEALRELGMKHNIGVADVYAVWEEALAAGKTPESLLLNNINHPNDYGHELYFIALKRLLEGDADAGSPRQDGGFPA